MSIYPTKFVALAAALLSSASLLTPKAAAADQRNVTVEMDNAVFKKGSVVQVNPKSTVALTGEGTLKPGAAIVPNSLVAAGNDWNTECTDERMRVKFDPNAVLRCDAELAEDNTSAEKDKYTEQNFTNFYTLQTPFIHSSIQLGDPNDIALSAEQRAAQLPVSSIILPDTDPALASGDTLIHLIAANGEYNQVSAPDVFTIETTSTDPTNSVLARFGSAGAEEAGKTPLPIKIRGATGTKANFSGDNSLYTGGHITLEGIISVGFTGKALPPSTNLTLADGKDADHCKLDLYNVTVNQTITCGDRNIVSLHKGSDGSLSVFESGARLIV